MFAKKTLREEGKTTYPEKEISSQVVFDQVRCLSNNQTRERLRRKSEELRLDTDNII